MIVWPHRGCKDWCHICGDRTRDNADVWYPANAEHGGKDTQYIRICVTCGSLIAEVAGGVDAGTQEPAIGTGS